MKKFRIVLLIFFIVLACVNTTFSYTNEKYKFSVAEPVGWEFITVAKNKEIVAKFISKEDSKIKNNLIISAKIYDENQEKKLTSIIDDVITMQERMFPKYIVKYRKVKKINNIKVAVLSIELSIGYTDLNNIQYVYVLGKKIVSLIFTYQQSSFIEYEKVIEKCANTFKYKK